MHQQVEYFNNCTLCPHCIYVFCICLRTNSDLCHLHKKLIVFITEMKCLQRGTDWAFKWRGLRSVFWRLIPKACYVFRTKENFPRIELRTADSCDTTPCGLVPTPVTGDETNQTKLLAEHLHFIRRVRKISESDYQLRHVCPSVRRSAWNNSASNG
jgi:hypothetical protein